FQDLKPRINQAFPIAGRIDPRKLPGIEVLAKKRGDAERGRELMAASAKNDMQCMKCHSIRGQGGNIGPDLSLIGKKGSRENLLALKTAATGMDYWHIAGPFPNGANDAGLDKPLPPESGIDLKASYPGKSGPVTWKTVRPDSQNYFDLQAFFSPASDDIVSYL